MDRSNIRNDETITDLLLTRSAAADGERERIGVVTDGLRVVLANAETLVKELPPERFVSPRLSTEALNKSWAKFLSQLPEERLAAESKALMNMAMTLMQNIHVAAKRI